MDVESPLELLVDLLDRHRLEDQLHVKDMDQSRLITAEIESNLPDALRARLAKIRAAD